MKTQTGRSMIEMLGVLAVIGVLSVGGLFGYQRAMRNNRINNAIAYVNTCFSHIRGKGFGIEPLNLNPGNGLPRSIECNSADGLGEPFPPGVTDASCYREAGGSTTCFLYMNMDDSFNDIIAGKLGINTDDGYAFHRSNDGVWTRDAAAPGAPGD